MTAHRRCQLSGGATRRPHARPSAAVISLVHVQRHRDHPDRRRDPPPGFTKNGGAAHRAMSPSSRAHTGASSGASARVVAGSPHPSPKRMAALRTAPMRGLRPRGRLVPRYPSVRQQRSDGARRHRTCHPNLRGMAAALCDAPMRSLRRRRDLPPSRRSPEGQAYYIMRRAQSPTRRQDRPDQVQYTPNPPPKGEGRQ